MQEKRQLYGYIASGVLAVGTLVPLVSLPIVGSLNYLGNLPVGIQSSGLRDGVFILTFAGAAAILAGFKKFKLILIPAIAALLLTSITLVGLIAKIAELRSNLVDSLAGNPFAGLATGLFDSIQFQWGWFVLYLGSVGLILLGLGILPKQAKQNLEESETNSLGE